MTIILPNTRRATTTTHCAPTSYAFPGKEICQIDLYCWTEKSSLRRRRKCGGGIRIGNNRNDSSGWNQAINLPIESICGLHRLMTTHSWARNAIILLNYVRGICIPYSKDKTSFVKQSALHTDCKAKLNWSIRVQKAQIIRIATFALLCLVSCLYVEQRLLRYFFRSLVFLANFHYC